MSCCIDNTNGASAGGTDPGTIKVTTPASQPENIIANRTVNVPTIAATCTGGINLQSEPTAAHGITANTDHAGILSGEDNIVGADFGVVCGGEDNDITGSSPHSVIGGGNLNVINVCDSGFIGGGDSNRIVPASGSTNNAAIVGGSLNEIFTAEHGAIGGGEDNVLGLTGTTANAGHSCITGGEDNQINRGLHSAILGGDTNVIGVTTDASFSVILGGRLNDIDGADNACAGGRQAQVTDAGAWVWSDSAAQDEDSQGVDSFFIKAGGGLFFRQTDGFKGEEVVQQQFHVSSTDAANVDTTIGTLGTDQHTFGVLSRFDAIRDTGANAFGRVADRRYSRVAGTVTQIGGAGLAAGSVFDGTGATVTMLLVISGDDIIARWNGNVGENWEGAGRVQSQEGGFTS